MRFLLAFISVLLLGAAFAGTASAEKYQGWAPRPASPDGVAHVHLETPTTMFQSYGGPTTVPVTVVLHHSLAKATSVRWSCESDVKQTQTISFQGDGSGEQRATYNLTVNPSLCPKGWQEIRWTVNTDQPDGSREFTTSRECANFLVGNGSSQNYCGGPTVAGRCGGGAWYTSTLYLIGFIDCRDWFRASAAGAGFHAGDKIRVRTQNSGGGIATFDPAFHASPPNPGVGIQTTPANNTWTTITIPALAPGQHTLHLRDNLKGFSGAVVMPLKIV